MSAETIFSGICAIGSIVGILVLVFKTGKVAQKIDNMEKDIADIKKSVGKHWTEITKIKMSVREHGKRITKIEKSLFETPPKTSLSAKCSPRRLNELGEKLYDRIQGDEFIEKNKTALFELIREENPLVALDVEQAAYFACLSLVKTPAFNKLKDFVYDEPSWELPDGSRYDATVDDICFVIGLRLRDRYLDEVGLPPDSEKE